MLSVVRQLAEAERSPITAIEEQHQGVSLDGPAREPDRLSPENLVLGKSDPVTLA